MTDDLVARLRAAIEETEKDARAAISNYRDGGADTWNFDNGESVMDNVGNHVAVGPWGCPIDDFHARLIVRGDPRKTLRRSGAYRKIVDQYVETVQIRDQAVDRINATKDCGETPDPRDLDIWGRADVEAMVMRGVLEHLAEGCDLATKETDGADHAS